MIAKPDRYEGFFLGCTNYEKNGTGCDKNISKKNFYVQMGYPLDELKGEETVLVSNIEKHEMWITGRMPDRKTDMTDVRLDFSDYVEIKKADIEPVMLGDWDL